MPRVCSLEDVITARYEIEVWMLEYLWFELIVSKERFIVARTEIECVVERGKLLVYICGRENSEGFCVAEYFQYRQELHLVLVKPFNKKEYAVLRGLLLGSERSIEDLLMDYCRMHGAKVVARRSRPGTVCALIRNHTGLIPIVMADGRLHYRSLLVKALCWYNRWCGKSLQSLTIIAPNTVLERIAPLVSCLKFPGGELLMKVLAADYSLAAGWQLDLPFVQLHTQDNLIGGEDEWHLFQAYMEASINKPCLSEEALETIVMRSPRVIDPELLPERIYRQIPIPRGRYREYSDLLAVRRDGRLVVMEVKVSEDETFPLQALDYWVRVEILRRQGYFDGLFGDLELADSPAMVYLIAPALRFHSNFRMISSFIDSSVPLFRIGINSDWRRGLRLYSFERAN